MMLLLASPNVNPSALKLLKTPTRAWVRPIGSDRFAPQKLQQFSAPLKHWGLVSLSFINKTRQTQPELNSPSVWQQMASFFLGPGENRGTTQPPIRSYNGQRHFTPNRPTCVISSSKTSQCSSLENKANEIWEARRKRCNRLPLPHWKGANYSIPVAIWEGQGSFCF